MVKKPLVSIIILNYNGGETTEQCINSVLKTTKIKSEIILVDNGSDKQEYTKLFNCYGKNIRIIRSKINLGYAAGNNHGVKYSQGKYLVFLNNDTLVSPNWLIKTIEKLSMDPKIAFLQPKIRWISNKNYFEYAGGAGGYLDFYGYPFARGRIFGSLEEDKGQYDDEKEIMWASGVALFCRKETFLKLKGFDPLFFAYAEETDLCLRALRAGYKNIYIPSCIVFHKGGFTSNRNIKLKTFLIHRNHLILLIKNYRFTELLFILPVRLFLDSVAMFYYLVRYRSFKNAFSVITAYGSLFRNIKYILNKRQSDKIKNFGYPKNENIGRKSILFEYFIFNKFKYSDIVNSKKIRSHIYKLF